MQDRRDADPGAEALGIGCDRQCRLGRRLEQDVVEDRLVRVGKAGDRPRQGVDDMEVRDRQQLGFPLLEPCARGGALMWWTAPAPGIECAIG